MREQEKIAGLDLYFLAPSARRALHDPSVRRWKKTM
jgi:hypothetical protein